MKNILKSFPSAESLLKWYYSVNRKNVFKVNGHIHTPYSFSSFQETEQAFTMASAENVKVLGINDFYSTDGYEDFYNLSLAYNIFPLFNIEFMGLLKDAQEKGVRINDPNNPGRIYFSGKGLDFPVNRKSNAFNTLTRIKDESHVQTRAMVEKTSEYMELIDPRLRLEFSEILDNYTKGMVRERHIARAVRDKSFGLYKTIEERFDFFKKLYDGKPSSVDMNDISGLENEIRSQLLKAGGKAFVKEDSETFLNLNEIINTILELGGIPCYPVLLDDSKGFITSFEQDYERLYKELSSNNIYCIELIPGRNDPGKLEEFVRFFQSKNYIILFGTEHNSPNLHPVTVTTKNGDPLNDYLQRVSYEGACVIAAHQYMRAKGMNGFINNNDISLETRKKKYIETGAAIIEYYLQFRPKLYSEKPS